jgi:hypothetical protein
MQLRTVLFGAGLALAVSGPAAAQTVLDGSSVDEILNVAKGYGSATLDSQSNGDPKISGRIDGIPYQVYFMNCTDNTACQDVNFYAGFLDNKPDLETINAWNREKRFGKAYLDSDLDAVLEWDLNLEYGVTRENLDAAFSLWWLLLDQYTTYIGAR